MRVAFFGPLLVFGLLVLQFHSKGCWMLGLVADGFVFSFFAISQLYVHVCYAVAGVKELAWSNAFFFFSY